MITQYAEVKINTQKRCPEQTERPEFCLLTATAKILGLDVATLKQELGNGKSIAEVAQTRGLDGRSVTNWLIAQEQAFITAQKRQRLISFEEAEEWREETTVVTPFIVKLGYQKPECVALKTIGIDEQTFFTDLGRGKPIKEIAIDCNVNPQTVVDAITTSENALVDHLLQSGIIESYQAVKWKEQNYYNAQEIVGYFRG